MNILILTVDRNYHSPIILRSFFHAFLEDNIQVYISSPFKKYNFKTLLIKYNLKYLYHKLRERLIYKWNVFRESISKKNINERKYIDIYSILNFFNINHKRINNINCEEIISEIKNFNPDIIISLYFDKILKKKVLKLSKHKPINLHPSLLPSYAGSVPTFWVLAKGEEHTGITIHEMIEKVDAGPIVYQEKIPIFENDTQFSLYRRCSLHYIDPLVRIINSYKTDKLFERVKINENIKKSYYSSKVKQVDINDFLKKGRIFI